MALNFAFAHDVDDLCADDGSFKEIQDKIDSANPKETIHLDGKSYTSNGTSIKVNKSLTIDGAGLGSNDKAIFKDVNNSRVFEISKGCNVVLKNIIFQNISFKANGACVYHAGGNLTLNNCIFNKLNVSTTSTILGYGVNVAGYSNVTFDNIQANDNFIQSTNYIYGGLFCFNSYSNVKLSNIKSYNNTVLTSYYLCGGLLYQYNYGTLEIYGLESRNNTCLAFQRIYGGNIYYLGGNISIKDTLITENHFKSTPTFSDAHDIDGAGILIFYKSQIQIDNYKFVNNIINCTNPKQGPGGVGFFVQDRNSFCNLSNCLFENNKIYHAFSPNADPLVASSSIVQGVVRLSGYGILFNSTFNNNYVDNGMVSLQITPGFTDKLLIVDQCKFYNNLCGASFKDVNQTYFANHGGAICVSGTYKGSSAIRNCEFVNNTNAQGGAITPHNNCIVEYCVFINNTATKFYGGAISTENGFDINNANVTIRYCYFEGNSAPIGGAIQAKGDYVKIYNCSFKNNCAVQGGAVFLEGTNLSVLNCTFDDNNATRSLDFRIVIDFDYLPQIQVWNAFGGAIYIHGNNSKIENNRFLYNSAIHKDNESFEGKGGAIYIYGDNATLLNNYFDDNFVHSGNGSAIYIRGINSTINLCEFYNHDAGRGTVFIRGSLASILNSIFKSNTASLGGAGIYSIGNYSLVDNCIFEDNNATVHGGAIHSHGDYISILYSKFISNNAHPHDEKLDNGLGGAIFTQGNFNDIAYCEFDFNTARNGSAIYNRGSNLTVEECNFHFNQAYSYNLFIIVTPKVSNFTKNNKIIVNITHIGGDNIINAIYNDGSYKNIFFLNVTYEHSSTAGGKRNSGPDKVNPVESAEKSNDGQLIYQDSREDLQLIDLILTRESEANNLLGASIQGDVVQKLTGRTGLYGNITFTLSGNLKPGKYNVYASHPDDRLYKGIQNLTSFEILPRVDLSILKSSDKDSYFVGDTATFTITVTSLGSDAHNVVVHEIIPDSFKLVSYKTSKGTFDNNMWFISNVEGGAFETLILKVKLTKTGTFTNIVNVTTSDNDTDLSNNIANKTVKAIDFVDIKITKTSNVKTVKVGDKIVWTISVTNLGTLNATGVKVSDKLSKSLKYISYTSTKGFFNPKTGVWSIDDLKVGETQTLTLTTKVLSSGLITNTVIAFSNEIDSNKTNNKANFTINAKNSDIHINKTNNAKKDSLSNKSNKLHETGNPIVLILLALISTCILFKRKK